jgi:short-subunit dehydrogenase
VCVRWRMTFAGTTALVTGGASGIGKALGAALEGAGARVELCDIVADGGACRLLDVRDSGAFSATHEMSASHWDRIIDVNIQGVVNGVRAVYPSMIERGQGQIVNVASGAGLVAPPFVAAYAMTKHAVVGLSTALRPEAALHGVRVSVLCPGPVDTAILDRLPDADLPPTASAAVSARRYLAAVRQKPIDVDRFARLAMKAIERDHGIIVVPASARSLWYLHRLSPALTGRITKLLARRIERTLIAPRT